MLVHYTMHPATAAFVQRCSGDDPALRLSTHRRAGEYLEARAKDSPYKETDIEAGRPLFLAGEVDRA